MAEHEDWTEADDALVRRAMATLRADVEAAPLADARFVRARGTHRRRRQQLVTWAAAAAAAVVVAGVAGYAAWGPEPAPAPLPPAHPSTTQAPTTTPSRDTGIVTGAEWRAAAGLNRTPVVQPQPRWEGTICSSHESGKRTAERVVLDAQRPDDSLVGIQTRWDLPSQAAAEHARLVMIDSLHHCAAPIGMLDMYSAATRVWPLPNPVFRYTVDGQHGWVVVAQHGRSVVWLELTVPSRTGAKDPLHIIDELYFAALRHLGASPAAVNVPTGSTSSSAQPPTGPKAIDEAMPVVGPDPKPSSKLFVAASQWESTALTGGKKTSAGPGALEGSTAVASCETDEQQAGIGGSVGIVSVRTGSGPASYIGRQRVQLDQSGEPALQKDYVSARLREAQALFVKGCTFPNGTVKSTKGPTQGTFRLDTVSKDGRTLLTEWVGVTAQKTPGAVTTIVVTKVADPSKAFAELDRLLALARQK